LRAKVKPLSVIFDSFFGEDRPAGAAAAVLLFQTLLLAADHYASRVGPDWMSDFGYHLVSY
jgi:hypothetical protein